MKNLKKVVRFVCISDTHCKTDNLHLPEGDVLIHAGDFTKLGDPQMVSKFNEWLAKQSHPIKVVIAGNHDITFDLANYQKLAQKVKFIFLPKNE